jgi:regulator of cell morphogenesis and NO signaling
MMDLAKAPTVGSFVAKDYRTAGVFQKYGIDFCCKGGQTLDKVCEKKQINPDRLLSELTEVIAQPGDHSIDFRSWPLDLLTDYIEKKHHRYIVQTTPGLKQFLDKLCKVHGERHPELFRINEEFTAASGELAMHMKKEELILFPFVRKMVSFRNSHETMDAPRFGTVKNPIQTMMQEHDVEGERFRIISELSMDYTAPADGCTTYRVAYSMLKEFEADLHMHIHLENNILFPKAIEMEKEFV